MTIYAGTTIDLRVRGTDGRTQKIITGVSCIINLYGPGKNPRDNPEDREYPDYSVSTDWDPDSRYYVRSLSTKGWTPGTWWMQGVLSGGAYDAFEFESFTLSP
jgi:hypothetical protein